MKMLASAALAMAALFLAAPTAAAQANAWRLSAQTGEVRVTQPGHLLHGLPVLAFTMSDGIDYDFTSHTCSAWRFFFGEGELVCPPDSFPRLRGERIIGGYGHVAAQAQITECA